MLGYDNHFVGMTSHHALACFVQPTDPRGRGTIGPAPFQALLRGSWHISISSRALPKAGLPGSQNGCPVWMKVLTEKMVFVSEYQIYLGEVDAGMIYLGESDDIGQ